MTYVGIRNEAVKQIQAAFTKDKRLVVEAHPGSFNEGEIRRLATRTPAILTALVRINDRDVNDESWCNFVSWVLYRADNRDTLYDGALKIVSALIPVIRNVTSDWSIDGGSNIEADCLYSGSLDQMNITLWAVKWRWQVRAVSEDGEIPLIDDLDYFEGYEAVHVVGTQTAKDIVNLEVDNAHTNDANSPEPVGSGNVQ